MIDKQALTIKERFENAVGIKFQLYNSLFTSLPFNSIEKTGVLLSLFVMHCEEGYREHKSPDEIVESFFEIYTQVKTDKQKRDMLFRFIQYAERQIVLFDAVEDAAFTHIKDLNGEGSLTSLKSKLSGYHEQIKDVQVRVVLTAHPTQFYPGEVLGIIHDLSKALMVNNAADINTYLQQLGKTPFLKKIKPTPYDEAVNLIWFLDNTFYHAIGNIMAKLKASFSDKVDVSKPLLRLGFWPGGDRDGNPFVNINTTIQVANALKERIVRSYYSDVRKLRRRLTFDGVFDEIFTLEKLLSDNAFIEADNKNIQLSDIVHPLQKIKKTLEAKHNGMFVNLVDDVLNKIEIFGLYFATLDVRQDSGTHAKLFETLVNKKILPEKYVSSNDDEKIKILSSLKPTNKEIQLKDEVLQDTLAIPQAVKNIQQANGEEAVHRYIISHCTNALNVMEVYGLFLLNGWKPNEMSLDIVPLFETIDDLKACGEVMKQLYENKVYAKHLKQRNNTQTIMVGFSDGTKDGGYLMANWCIYKAKEALTQVSKEYGINVLFFDGRGGPPARGGGKTHKFYASMGNNIAHKQIQLTIQGQTISSNFGTIASTQYNLEQLLNAGISSNINTEQPQTLSEDNEMIIATIADESYKAYTALKTHPQFLNYLLNISPLQYYADTNIGSRPAKRNSSKEFSLNDLRAIPYVGAWTQLKQNVTGYYGLGTALLTVRKSKSWKVLQNLYKNSLYFKTLIDNSEMSMLKTFMPLTAHLKNNKQFGAIWKMINSEFELTKKMILELKGTTTLMQEDFAGKESIALRERIVLPLTTIQQYGLSVLRSTDRKLKTEEKETYEKLAMRCSFGIINAGRNSV